MMDVPAHCRTSVVVVLHDLITRLKTTAEWADNGSADPFIKGISSGLLAAASIIHSDVMNISVSRELPVDQRTASKSIS